MTEEVKKLIEKAEHALEVAEKLMNDGYPSDAASKIYYSMYYAAQALLKSEGMMSSSTQPLNQPSGITLRRLERLIPNTTGC